MLARIAAVEQSSARADVPAMMLRRYLLHVKHFQHHQCQYLSSFMSLSAAARRASRPTSTWDN